MNKQHKALLGVMSSANIMLQS